MSAPTKQDLMEALWTHCAVFIDEQDIFGPSAVHQTDRVIENAYEFIEGICDIVGYKRDEEGST